MDKCKTALNTSTTPTAHARKVRLSELNIPNSITVGNMGLFLLGLLLENEETEGGVDR